MKEIVILTGNLGGDPEMRSLNDGSSVTNFSMATNKRWTKNGEKHERVTWWRISVFGNQAEACNQYLEKGRLVEVVGEMNPDPQTGGPRIWTDRDGQARASYEVKASSVTFLSGAGDAGGGQAGRQAGGQVQEEDEIPF